MEAIERRCGAFARRLLQLLLAAAALLAVDARRQVVVRTEDGRVAGFAERGISTFLGIPYAAPPVGKLRFQPPVDAAPWAPTLLDATNHKVILRWSES